MMYGSVILEEKYVADKLVLKLKKHEESIKGNEQQALADFLKMMDDHKAGLIQDFGICCESKDGRVWRYKKTYTEAELQ